MLDFLRSVVPLKQDMGRKLISQDDHSNIKKFKYSYYAELATVAKEDFVCLSAKQAQAYGCVSNFMLCHKVSNNIHLVDPISLKTAEISAERYWHDPMKVVLTPDQLIEYTVMDIVKDEDGKGLSSFNKQNKFNSRICLAEVTIVRSSDFGVNDTEFRCVTHLGNVLQYGDTVLGYDLTNANLIEDVQVHGSHKNLPDVVLVRKTWPQRTKRRERRHWKLRQLAKQAQDKPMKKAELEKEEQEYEAFMQEVEEDPELRANMKLYKRNDVSQQQSRKSRPDVEMGSSSSSNNTNNADGQVNEDDNEDDGFPEIRMDELLDEMQEMKMSEPDAEDVPTNEGEDDQDLVSDEAIDQVINGKQLRQGGFAASTAVDMLNPFANTKK
jgi:nonsense-mediated mRNA decay protein 3